MAYIREVSTSEDVYATTLLIIFSPGKRTTQLINLFVIVMFIGIRFYFGD